MNELNVKQGDTSDVISVGSSSMIDTTGWTCTLRVLNPDGTAIINRVITETNDALDKFLVYLTPTETGALPIEAYRMIIELTNAATTPPFNVEQSYVLNVDPQYEVGDLTGLTHLAAGVNSFDTLENMLLKLAEMPQLTMAINASRNDLKGALMGAYLNIGKLTVDFGVEDIVNGGYKTSTEDFTSAELTALDAASLNVLLRAQLIEANALLGGHPVEDRRRAGMLSDSVGESAIFFRTSKPLQLPVYRDTAIAMKGYIIWAKSISR